MLIKRTRGWELPESKVTLESNYLNRREMVRATGRWCSGTRLAWRGTGAGQVGRSVRQALSRQAQRQVWCADADDGRENWPRPATSSTSSAATRASGATPRSSRCGRGPSRVSGMVETPFEIGIDDLRAKVQLEERVYRHRCVETWSMVVPWSGFPVRSLVENCKPLGSAVRSSSWRPCPSHR